MKRMVGWLVGVLGVVGASWGNEVVARIGGEVLSVAQYEARALELKKTGFGHIADFDSAAKRQLLDGIIARRLLVMEGVDRGYDREPEIAEAIDRTRRRTLISLLYERQAVAPSYEFSDEELRAFFKRMQYDREVLSQHIVCDSAAKAGEALQKIQGGAVFESLVAEYSTPHIQRRFGPGGWVGWFKVGEVYDELKEPLAAMEPGSLYPEPVETAIGHHVFRLKARRPVPFAPNREWVEKQARVHARAQDMERYIDTLRQRYGLERDDEVFAALQNLPAGTASWPGDDRALFTWQGGRLTAQEYMAEAAKGGVRHPAVLDSAGLHKAADNLAGRRIMMAEAVRLGLDDDESVHAAVDKERTKLLTARLFEEEVPKRARPAAAAAVRAFYDDNIAEFTTADGKVTEFSKLEGSIRKAMDERAAAQAMDGLIAQLRRKYADRIEVFPDGLAKAFAD